MTERVNLREQIVEELERLVQDVDVTLPGLAPGNVTGEVEPLSDEECKQLECDLAEILDVRTTRSKEMLRNLVLALGRVVNDPSKTTDKHNNLFIAATQCRAGLKGRPQFPGKCATKTRKGASRNERIRLLNDQIATHKASLRKMQVQEKEIRSRISVTQSRAREVRTSIVALQQELAKLQERFKQLNTDCDILVELKKLTQKDASPALRKIFNTVSEQTKRLQIELCGPVT